MIESFSQSLLREITGPIGLFLLPGLRQRRWSCCTPDCYEKGRMDVGDGFSLPGGGGNKSPELHFRVDNVKTGAVTSGIHTTSQSRPQSSKHSPKQTLAV